MRLLIKKLVKLRLGWNERVLTEADVYRVARRFRIKIVEMPLRTDGFYYRVMGRDYIAIDSRLTGTKKLFVLLHELAHFLFHTPESGATANFHHVGRRTRQEFEADAFALCALIPQTLLVSGSPLDPDGEFQAEMVRERLDLYETFGI